MRNKDTLILENLYEKVGKPNQEKLTEGTCCHNCGTALTLEECAYNQKELLLQEQKMKKINRNGVVIYQGNKFVCIATGLIRASENKKTGPMVQIFIIRSDVNPLEAVRTGKDATVCFNCKHRGVSCYVDLSKSVSSVYECFVNGNYPYILKNPEALKNQDDIDYYLQNGLWNIFKGKKVRFGAYGDPVRIPFPIVEKIASLASKHTGYTHQWANGAFDAYKKYFMASVDTPVEYLKAKSAGWRTFRVTPDWYAKYANEKACLAAKSGKTCYECLLCGGTSTPTQRDIYIKVHGATGKVDSFIHNFGINDGSIQVTPEERKEIEQIEKRELEEKKAKDEKKAARKAERLAAKNADQPVPPSDSSQPESSQ